MRTLLLLCGAASLFIAEPAAGQSGNRIALVHRPAPPVASDEPVVIEGHMLGASEVESAELFYRTSVTGGWRNLEFELVAGDHYRAVVPGGDVRPPTLEYYVVAIDFLEGRHAALGTAEQPVQIAIEPAKAPTPGPTRIFDPSAPLPPPPTPLPEVVAPPVPAPAPPPRGPARFAEAGWVVRFERQEIAVVGATTVADLLERVGGVHLRRELDGQWRLGFRGLESHGDVLVVLDGQLLNDPYDGMLLLSLPASVIERMEVQQGVAAGFVGTPAFAGVVRLTTPDETGLQVQAGGGSYASHTTSSRADHFGTYVARFNGGRSNETVRWTAFAAAVATDGTQADLRSDAYSTTPLSSQAPGPVRDGGVNLIAGTSVQLEGLLPGALRATGRYLLENRGGHVGAVDTYGPAGGQTWHVGLVGLDHALELAEGYALHTRVGAALHQRDTATQLAPKGFRLSDRNGDGEAEVFPYGVLEEVSTRSLALDAEVEASMPLVAGHNLRTGIWLGYATAAEPRVNRNIDTVGAASELTPVPNPPPLTRGLNRWSTSVRVEDEWSVHPRVELALGFRATYLSAVDRIELDKLFNLRLALLYRATKRINLRLLYGSSLRPPTLAERADQLAATLPPTLAEDRFRGNPRLPSAARHQIEAGIDYRGRLSDINVEGRAGGHYMRALNTIETIPGAAADPQTGLTLISSRAAVDMAGVDLHGRAGSTGNYVFVTSWWWRAFDWEEGEYTLLTAVPQLGAAVGLHFTAAELGEIDLFGRYDAERRNNTRTEVETLRAFRLPAQTSVHLALRSRPLPAGLRVGLLARNVFDSERRDPVPRPDIMPDQLPGEGLLILGTVELEVP